MNIHEKSRITSSCRSLNDPRFWAEAAREIDWIERPKDLRCFHGHYGRWFIGGVVNTCFNALDRHVAVAGRSVALITIRRSPYGLEIHLCEMLREVQRSPP